MSLIQHTTLARRMAHTRCRLYHQRLLATMYYHAALRSRRMRHQERFRVPDARRRDLAR